MDSVSIKAPARKQRRFLPTDYRITNWQSLQPYYNQLVERPINSTDELHQLLLDQDEVDCMLGEYARRLNISITCDTTNKEAQKEYENFLKNINPHLSPYYNQLGQKILSSPFVTYLPQDQYAVYLRSVKKNQEIYRLENIPLFVEIGLKQNKYSSITGGMMVYVNGQEETLQQAHKHFNNLDSKKRQEAFEAIAECRLASKDKLNELFDDLITLRHQCALNADYANFRDFKFASLGRFDYTPDDCIRFHDAIAQEIVPLAGKILERQKQALQLTVLRPWDKDIDPSEKSHLLPFQNTTELIEKSMKCLRNVKTEFGDYLEIMHQMGHLDLDSRKGKAPGGYNTSLPETNVPFIFMNAVGLAQDIRTMLHEAGHAIHAFLETDLEISAFKSPPSEVTELASMSMELISMEHWNVFFPNTEELRRAKIKQLEKIILSLPSLAIGDSFQHWVYLNPQHTHAQRAEAWQGLMKRFSSAVVDWSGYEEYQNVSWQQILHFYLVPFYYIEYAMAQLGAIAIWKTYRENPQQALQNYTNALKLGYTRPIGEIYTTAGIRFDFSQEYVRELAQFLMAELEDLYQQNDQAAQARKN